MVDSVEFGSGGNCFGGTEEDDFAATTTVIELLARVRAICLPIPLLAPMTMTTGDEDMSD